MDPLGGDSGDSRQRKSQSCSERRPRGRDIMTHLVGRPGSMGQGSMKIRKQSLINTPDTHISAQM